MVTSADTHFEVVLEGAGLHPSTTPIGVLGNMLRTLSEAIQSANPDPASEDPQAVTGLLAVEEGSTRLRFVGPGWVAALMTATSTAVASSEWKQVPETARKAFRQLAETAEERDWTVRVHSVQPSHDFDFRLDVADSIPLDTTRVFVTGTTTLFGRCLMVGGKRPRAQIELASGTVIRSKVTKTLARELAKRLYDEIGLIGTAKWSVGSWEVVAFDATGLSPFLRQPADPFRRLADTSGGAWVNRDAAEYVAKLREE